MVLSERFWEHLLVQTVLKFLHRVLILIHSVRLSADSFMLWWDLHPRSKSQQVQSLISCCHNNMKSHPETHPVPALNSAQHTSFGLHFDFCLLEISLSCFQAALVTSSCLMVLKYHLYPETTWKLYIHNRPLQTYIFSCSVISHLYVQQKSQA